MKKIKSQNAENIKMKIAQCDRTFEKDFDLSKLIDKELENEILKSDIIGLRKLLIKKKISSTNLVKFYYMRAKTIGRQLNAAVESNIDNALELALKADKKLQNCTDSIFEEFPILGIPFSIKESISMAGFDITQGFSTRIGYPEKETAPIIQELINKGGIPFVRTNIPQALMAIESTNEIYGTCQNAFNKDRTSGGSSGGEGSLIGSLCSPFGIGSDIGGSIRNPAHNNGIFALKPTSMRTGVKGHTSISPFFNEHSHQHYIHLVLGPLCKSAEDLNILMSILGQKKLNNDIEYSIPPTEWVNDKVSVNVSKIKVGYFTDMPKMAGSSRLTKKAVSSTVATLEELGIPCERFYLPDYTPQMLDLILKIFQLDGNIDSVFETSRHGIETVKVYDTFKQGWLLPKWLKYVVAYLLQFLSRFVKPISARFVMLVKSSIKIECSMLFKETNQQVQLCQDFLKLMRKQGITHLICPTHCVPAQEHNMTGESIIGSYWTSLFNLIGNPVGVLPIGTVESLSKSSNLSKQDKTNLYLSQSPQIDQNGNYFDDYVDNVSDGIEKIFQTGCKKPGMNNLPIGIQVVGMMWEDESVVGLMKIIQDHMKLSTIGEKVLLE